MSNARREVPSARTMRMLGVAVSVQTVRPVVHHEVALATLGTPDAREGWTGPTEVSVIPSVQGQEILQALAQHRYCTIQQLRRFAMPHVNGARHAGVHLQVQKLAKAGLVQHAQVDARHVGIYCLTPAGLEMVPARQRREYVATTKQAGGLDYRHSWAMNEVALSFIEAACRRDDECGVMALDHEVCLRKATSPGGLVVADGLLQYYDDDTGKVYSAIVELDRKTKPGRLTDRLRAYVEVKRTRKLWARSLPDGWPPILLVLSEDPRTGPRLGEKNWAGDPERSRIRVERFMGYLAGVAAQEPALKALEVRVCPLPALIAQGPFAPIWSRLGRPESLDWLGNPAMVLRKGGVA